MFLRLKSRKHCNHLDRRLLDVLRFHVAPLARDILGAFSIARVEPHSHTY